MDKKLVENKLAKLDDKVDRLQEPIVQVVDAINNLIDDTKGTNSEELVEFKIQLLEILDGFYEKMVVAHDEIIEDCENIDKMINQE